MDPTIQPGSLELDWAAHQISVAACLLRLHSGYGSSDCSAAYSGLVTRLQPFRLPGRAARQLPDQSTTLWVESSAPGDPRLRGALPEADVVDLREPRFFACSAAARRSCRRGSGSRRAWARSPRRGPSKGSSRRTGISTTLADFTHAAV